jgi:DNA-binding MarR family transcriptional regulator
VPSALSYDLHKLTARLDRAADAALQREAGITYARFLALFAVRESAGNQRQLAQWLGQTEPSTSRMVAVLAREGLLTVTTTAGAGNRRQLTLTDRGAALVDRGSRMLEDRFKQLVKASGVAYTSYHRDTQRLLDQLEQPTHSDLSGAQ